MGPTISWTWCLGVATRRAYPTRWSGSGTTTGTRTGRSFPRADCRGRRLLRTPDPEASGDYTEGGGWPAIGPRECRERRERRERGTLDRGTAFTLGWQLL